MLSDELMNGKRKGLDDTIGLSPEDQEGLDLALQILRAFDRFSISADELATDRYLGEEGVAEYLSWDGTGG
jgi:hypothetical protein